MVALFLCLLGIPLKPFSESARLTGLTCNKGITRQHFEGNDSTNGITKMPRLALHIRPSISPAHSALDVIRLVRNDPFPHGVAHTQTFLRSLSNLAKRGI